jgi:hypothetical protein
MVKNNNQSINSINQSIELGTNHSCMKVMWVYSKGENHKNAFAN